MIYHIATAADWARARRDGRYTTSTRGRTLAEEGFIHASSAAQVAPVANAYYRGMAELIVLIIDPLLVGPEIRYEPVPGSDAVEPTLPPTARWAALEGHGARWSHLAACRGSFGCGISCPAWSYGVRAIF